MLFTTVEDKHLTVLRLQTLAEEHLIDLDIFFLLAHSPETNLLRVEVVPVDLQFQRVWGVQLVTHSRTRLPIHHLLLVGSKEADLLN